MTRSPQGQSRSAAEAEASYQFYEGQLLVSQGDYDLAIIPLEDCIAEHAPPLARGRRIKLRYAHQGGRNPPLIVIHGTQTQRLPATYRRYLVNTFRKAFDLQGTPVRLELKSGENPYAGRRNKLTPRQERKRARLKKLVKRKKH